MQEHLEDTIVDTALSHVRRREMMGEGNWVH